MSLSRIHHDISTLSFHIHFQYGQFHFNPNFRVPFSHFFLATLCITLPYSQWHSNSNFSHPHSICSIVFVLVWRFHFRISFWLHCMSLSRIHQDIWTLNFHIHIQSGQFGFHRSSGNAFFHIVVDRKSTFHFEVQYVTLPYSLWHANANLSRPHSIWIV